MSFGSQGLLATRRDRAEANDPFEEAGMAEQADAADSKSVGSNSMGVRFPLPAPSILFVFSSFAGAVLARSDTSGTNTGTVRILPIFNRLKISGAHSWQQYIYSYACLRSITECAADKVSANAVFQYMRLARFVNREEKGSPTSVGEVDFLPEDQACRHPDEC
jgi:hypothetical protein